MFIILVISSSLTTQAQIMNGDHFVDGEWYFGFKAGASYNKIEQLKPTIIADFYPEDSYQIANPSGLGYFGGIFLFNRFEDSNLAIQPEITYAYQENDFGYSDGNLEYNILFKYHYINILPMLKVYPFGGMHIGIGPQLGFNIEKNNIDYESNMPEIGPDLQIRENLRQVLVGENDFSVVMSLGYEFKSGLSLEARYKVGFTDVIETQANGYNFTDQDNKSHGFQLTLGYAIPFNQ